MSETNIYLIGFMGSGKTTVGKLLAQKTGFQFADTDDEIEKKYNRSIAEIFEVQGETTFRNYEKEIISVLTESKNNCIISTGGGLPVFNQLMDLLNKKGTTVYLNCTAEVLVNRLEKNKTNRPLLFGKEIKEVIITKLKEREKIYSQAHFTVNGNLSPDRVVEEIVNVVKPPVVE